MNFKFLLKQDDIETVTTIYNSKTASILVNDINCDYVRIDILDESIDEINNIIKTILSGKRLEGENYTNGNLNRIV